MIVAHGDRADLTLDLTATGGVMLDKVEGLAIAANVSAWISTDNDGATPLRRGHGLQPASMTAPVPDLPRKGRGGLGLSCRVQKS